MDKAPWVLLANQTIKRSAPAPRLKLLVDWEPRRRVFLQNLRDLLFSRPLPPLRITSRPAPFWKDVFVPTGAPWSSFLESVVWHLLVLVLFVWAQSRATVELTRFSSRDGLRRSITYYPPNSFPAAEGRAPTQESRTHRKQVTMPKTPAHRSAMAVRPEQKPRLVTPPDLKQAIAKPPDFLGSQRVTPMVPFSATANPRHNSFAGSSGAVAPPPQVDQARTSRGIALPQASPVAPTPDLATSSVGRPLKAPDATGMRVIPPSPSIQNASNSARVGQLNSVTGNGSNVIAPPPSVQTARNSGVARLAPMTGSQVVPPPPSVQGSGSTRSGRLGSMPNSGANVIAPPPSVQGTGRVTGADRLGSVRNAGQQVVPPPPAVQGTGSAGQTGRLSSLSGGPNVVAPPPSVQGSGSATHTRLGATVGSGPQVVPPPPAVQGSGGGTRLNSFAGGSRVVPPPPSTSGAMNSRGGGRVAPLTGDGSQIVPPPPSVQGSGSADNGRLGSLVAGSDVAPPPVSARGLGNAGGGSGKILEQAPVLDAQTPSSVPGTASDDRSTIEELPLGLLGVIWVPPGTSYFSNFEVFVAKRRVAKNQLRLIKLVYEFLPYQRRLSEYNLNNMPQRVIKLRVTPDPSCDESLAQMMQTPGDSTGPANEYPTLPEALLSTDINAVLPCFRTNADDFQKAMSQAH